MSGNAFLALVFAMETMRHVAISIQDIKDIKRVFFKFFLYSRK